MKKQMFFVAGLCLSLITTQQSFSQTSLPFQFASTSIGTSSAVAEGPDPVASEESAVNSKTLSSFRTSYPAASEVKWSTNSKGSYAYFVSEGSILRVSYDRRGRWASSIRTLQVEKLPADVTNLINNAFPDYTVFAAHDVKVVGGSAYIVKIESPSQWKTLKVTDDGIDVIEDFVKQK